MGIIRSVKISSYLQADHRFSVHAPQSNRSFGGSFVLNLEPKILKTLYGNEGRGFSFFLLLFSHQTAVDLLFLQSIIKIELDIRTANFPYFKILL